MEWRANPSQLRILGRIDFLIGGLICAITALGACVLAAGHPWNVWVPLFFTGVLLLTALLFGARAGVIGTLAAALVFAEFLFRPMGSLRVSSAVARSNLGWMLLIGIALSFLFAPPRSKFRQ
jgi:K+-sensing histidine kinase KdpD